MVRWSQSKDYSKKTETHTGYRPKSKEFHGNSMEQMPTVGRKPPTYKSKSEGELQVGRHEGQAEI
jgi:hypothetical protein